MANEIVHAHEMLHKREPEDGLKGIESDDRESGVELPQVNKSVLSLTFMLVSLLPGVASAQAVPNYQYGTTFSSGYVWIKPPGPWYAAQSGGASIAVPRETQASFTVTSAMREGYFPNISSGCEAFDCTSGYHPDGGRPFAYPVQLKQEGNPLATVIGHTSAGYAGNLALDLWLSNTPQADSAPAYACGTNPRNSDTEVMIWLTHPADYPGSPADYATWIDGRPWRVIHWPTRNGCRHGTSWNLVIFEAPQIANGNVMVHNLKLNTFLGYSIRNGWGTSTEWLDSIDTGFEMQQRGAGNSIVKYGLGGVRLHPKAMYCQGSWTYVRPVGVFHRCQPGLGWVTIQPGDCLTWWHLRLRAPALHASVTPPLSYGTACSESEA